MDLAELRDLVVGSQVRVVRRDPHAGTPRHPKWQPEMDSCLGKTGTIAGFCESTDAVRLSFQVEQSWAFHHTSLELMSTKTEKRDRKNRQQDPYYHPKEWTLAELEKKIGARGSVQRRGFKRNLVIMWLRIKTKLPFKPDLWALPSRVARNFYNDKTDEMWKEWAAAHPALWLADGSVVPKVDKVKRGATAVVHDAEPSPFETTLVVKRHRVV